MSKMGKFAPIINIIILFRKQRSFNEASKDMFCLNVALNAHKERSFHPLRPVDDNCLLVFCHLLDAALHYSYCFRASH